MLPVIGDFKVAPDRDSIRLTLTVTGMDETNERASRDWQAYFRICVSRRCAVGSRKQKSPQANCLLNTLGVSLRN